MDPTRRLPDRSGLAPRQIELVVAIIGVGLQDAGIPGQMPLGMLAPAVAGVVEHRRRRPRTSKRPVVPDVDPAPSRISLALGQHRHGRVSRPEGFHLQRALRPSALVPRGFDVESAVCDGAATVITGRPTSDTRLCPGCGASSGRIHSRYQRLLTDLPLAGRPVRLVVVASRFRCVTVMCGRRIFTERFDDGALAPWARRTARLDLVVHHVGLALGGRPAASFARRLMLPVSNDTLLRVVRRRGCPPFAAPSVIGIDDWAWRRNQRYGTICDLERRRPITLLPDREPATAQARLAGQPQIAVVARDRGGGYALAAIKALPQAPQVADRWQLMENASHAFLDAVRNLCARSASRSAPPP
ncbi:hypothetical protein ACVIYL_009001 [Bradyrhizobium sp. USDA 3315]